MIRSGVGDKRWVYDKIGEGKDNKEGVRQIRGMGADRKERYEV
jgi:hypothetical protein